MKVNLGLSESEQILGYKLGPLLGDDGWKAASDQKWGVGHSWAEGHMHLEPSLVMIMR